MRQRERWQYLAQGPNVIWNLLIRGRYDYTYDLMPVRFYRIPWAKRINLVKAGLNLFYRRLTPWSRPINMQFELTNYCDLKCPVCPTGIHALSRPPTAMDPALFEGLMKDAGPYLLTASLFAWGEPLLHPRLFEILDIASRYSVATILSTNGQRLNNQKVLDALVRHPPTYLIVALDGLSDATNSVYRVGAKIEPALDGIRRLADLKQKRGTRFPILHWRYIVMNHNQHEVPQLKNFAIENRFELLSIRSLSIIDANEKQHNALVPDGDNYKAYNYDRGQRIRRRDFICQHAFGFPSVFSDGTVTVCDQDYNARSPYGVVSKTRSFTDVWFSKQAARVRRQIKYHPKNFSTCRNCPYADRPISTCSIKTYDLRDEKNRYIPRICH